LSVDISSLHGVLKDRERTATLEALSLRGTLSYSEMLELLGIQHTGSSTITSRFSET